MMNGIEQLRTCCLSSDETIITIEADESTPLLVDRVIWIDNNIVKYNNNNKSKKINNNNKKLTLKYGLSSPLSFNSSDHTKEGDNGSDYSTKSFKSHFTELKVLALALILAVAISIAIYLLVIESRLPSITLSLDLVSHDIWSQKRILQYNHLRHNSIDHIILMQTGNRNCDISRNCFEILKEMQNNEAEELPYNFLIGGDGHVYEVRGWKYQSGIKGTLQEKSLVIGIIGKFEQSLQQKIILRSIKSLIDESSKRKMINRRYYIYELRRNGHEWKEGEQLFTELMKWPEFKGLATIL